MEQVRELQSIFLRSKSGRGCVRVREGLCACGGLGGGG